MSEACPHEAIAEQLCISATGLSTIECFWTQNPLSEHLQKCDVILADFESNQPLLASLEDMQNNLNSDALVIALVQPENRHRLPEFIDESINKPFRIKSLLNLIESLLNRRLQLEEAELKIGTYRFHPHIKRMITKSGTELRLTEKETAILHFLHKAGDSVKREVLLEEVWGYNSRVTTHTLETHIYRLRQKIEPDPLNASLLVTEPDGYRLVI